MIELAPWLLGHGSVLDAAKAKCEAHGLAPRVYEVLDAQSQAFFALLNAANQVAFGGLGMPAWVQLDCCTLPGLMVGWGGERGELPDALITRVEQTLREQGPAQVEASGGHAAGFWPYSEFCGIRRGNDELVGVSTFSLLARRGLGLRAKALGLWLSGAKTQVGMTQWDNAAAALHCCFGPLRIIAAQTANHSRPAQTFVYSLQVPSEDRLLAMLQGQATSESGASSVANEVLEMTPSMGATVQAWIDAGQRVELLNWTPQDISFRRSAQ